jgi:predicted acetyltransferase
VGHDIRVLNEPDELLMAQEVFLRSFVGMPAPPEPEDITDFYERGRALGVFVDDELVGTAASFTSSLVVPGGARVSHAAVTDVGVLPTHTRQGLASALLGRQLWQIAERGETVATLRASEAVIYERFGYGIASSEAEVQVSVARAALRPGLPAGGPVRLVDPKASWDLLARIHADLDRVGEMERPAVWWNWQAETARTRTTPSYVVVHGAPGAEDGFARYRPVEKGRWLSDPDRTIEVSDFVARTPQAYYGLLRYLTSIDLVQRVVFVSAPADHAIGKLLVDERAARTAHVGDETWLRLIDVQAALAARSYRGTGSVALEVTDRQLPGNDGTYLVSATEVYRAHDETDIDTVPRLSLDVAALATVYLGGTRWWQLAEAGRVTELEPGALAVAEELFGTDRLPFCGTGF